MRLTLAAAAALIFSFPAFAQEEGGETSPKTKDSVLVKPAAGDDEGSAGMGSSEANRGHKIAYVGGEVGLGMIFPASGLEVGYFVSPDLTISANYIASSFTVFGTSIGMNLATVRANYFFGNSFYAGLGLGQREVTFKFSLDGVDANGASVKDQYKLDAKASSFGADLGIGNRWQWSGFWLGCEWIGYFAPLSSSGSSKLNAPAGASPQDTKDSQKALDQLAKTGNGQLLRLAAGWAF